jgi:hypothetical protein
MHCFESFGDPSASAFQSKPQHIAQALGRSCKTTPVAVRRVMRHPGLNRKREERRQRLRQRSLSSSCLQIFNYLPIKYGKQKCTLLPQVEISPLPSSSEVMRGGHAYSQAARNVVHSGLRGLIDTRMSAARMLAALWRWGHFYLGLTAR